MKFLIIRLSSIGDIVLTTPVVRCLKLQVAGAEIHFLTKPSFEPILSSNPYIDKIHLWSKDRKMLTAILKKENFNVIIDLHNNLRTIKIKSAFPIIPHYSFNKLNVEKWLLTALKINVMPGLHIVDRYLATLKSYGVKNDGKGLDYFIPENNLVSWNELPTSHQHGYIAIVIGAAHETKKLPVLKLQQLCKSISHPIILIGGKEDAVSGEMIKSIDPVKIYNACGKFSLNESADLIQKSKAVITHDTGMMHIAAAFKKPIISVWGNTVPSFGMTPYFGDGTSSYSRIFEIKKLYCRPCSKIGYKKCPLGHFKCMQLQNVEEMAEEVMHLIKK